MPKLLFCLIDDNILIKISSPNVQYIFLIVYVETINWDNVKKKCEYNSQLSNYIK